MSGNDQDTAVTDVNGPVPVARQPDCLVVIHDKKKLYQGKRFDLLGRVVHIGRQVGSEITLEEEGVSRVHARVERTERGWVLMDVGSKNGTLHNDREVSSVRLLRNGDRVKIGSVILKYLSGSDVEAAFYEEVYQTFISDNLTQLANRNRFDERLQVEFVRARRHGRPLSLVLLDVDFFKNVNDSYGHQVGDAVLANIGRILNARLRGDDLGARVGGEEFAMLLPETRLEDARALADELRTTIDRTPAVINEVEIGVSVSAGCAALDDADTSVAELYGRADERLYAAKEAGRNRVLA